MFTARFWPQRCFSCGRELEKSDLLTVCRVCAGEIQPLGDEDVCRCCGRSLYGFHAEFCFDCAGKKFCFDSSRSLFSYKEPLIRELVSRFKFESNLPAGRDLAEIIKISLENALLKAEADVMIITPVSRETLRKRGFNQTEWLIRKSGLNIPVENWMDRLSHSGHQSELGLQERREWIRGQFVIKPEAEIKGKRILVFDDVLTTCSTADEISHLLKSNGAAKVQLITFFCN